MSKVKVGMVGLNFGRYIIENMINTGPASPYFELAAVCRRDKEKCDEAARAYGVKAYYEIEDLLADDEIPVIVDMTGPNGRADRIMQMIRAGKDVMSTKPFEQSSAKAAEVLAEARKLHRIVYLNSPAAVMNKDFETIRAWEKKYKLGRIVAGHHECWYKSIEKADGSWYDDPKQCPAAPILRLGIYGINDLVQLFGEPEEVQVMETRLFTGRPTPDLARACIKFKNGAIVDTLDGWVCQPKRGAQSLILYYENGTIFRNPTMMPEDFKNHSTHLCVVTKDSEFNMPEETLVLQHDELSSFYAWEAFHQAVTTRKRPVKETPDSAIVDAIRILEAVARASENGGYAKV
ncbi:MAG: Gfo/Idh/MocA family protein [Kiritimatiellia bacterium]